MIISDLLSNGKILLPLESRDADETETRPLTVRDLMRDVFLTE